MATRLSRAAAIRAWATAQNFGGASALGPGEVVRDRSWVRTLGGADPYFALFARGVGIDLAAVDAAVASGEVRVSPAVRGCMYLVAREHADLALSLAYHESHKRSARDLAKAGGTAAQVRKTAKAVAKALGAGPATTAELRAGPAAKSIVSFGDVLERLADSPLPVNAETRGRAATFVEGLRAVGATRMVPAIEDALAKVQPRQGCACARDVHRIGQRD